MGNELKIITFILSCQFVLGLAVARFAFGDMHSAAMGMEYSRGLERDFAQLMHSPEYPEPPEIRGYSFSRLIEDRYSSASQLGNAAFLAFGTGVAASLLASALLWLLWRVRQRYTTT